MYPKINLVLDTTINQHQALPLETLYVRGNYEVISAIDDVLFPAKKRLLLFVGGSRLGGMRITRGAANWPEIYGLVRTAEYLVNHPNLEDHPDEIRLLKIIESSEKEKIDKEACRWLLNTHYLKKLKKETIA